MLSDMVCLTELNQYLENCGSCLAALTAVTPFLFRADVCCDDDVLCDENLNIDARLQLARRSKN